MFALLAFAALFATCRDAAPHLVERLVSHRVSYLPPSFDCVLEDGTTYPSSGGYVWLNGLVVTCAAVCVLLAVGARCRTAREMRVPDPERVG
ncbi:hypothetical protein ABZ465_11900 [Streptomyces griseoincarnatus]